jgi:hypothetical protein
MRSTGAAGRETPRMATKHVLVKPARKVNVDATGKKRQSHRYVVKSRNGEIVHTSQVYYDKPTATRAARTNNPGLPVTFA